MSAATVRIGLHGFSTYARHKGCDGANLAYTELFDLVHGSGRFTTVQHDLLDLLKDDRAALAALGGCDAVLANVGPHAYFYFYLRERLGLEFRIVRDVRTALWNGYLLQEYLVAPYLRSGDSVFYSSAYSRDLFSELVPHVPTDSKHVCYPISSGVLQLRNIRREGRRREATKIIGFVGRMTDDKNFHQALDLAEVLSTRRPGKFALLAVGESSRAVDALTVQTSRRFPGCPVHVRPPVRHSDIRRCYESMDLLFFPSTSSLETFGRVLVEAGCAGLPVLASSHGAASELLDRAALLPTRYPEQAFPAHFARRLGEVDVVAAAECVASGSAVPRSEGYRRYIGDSDRLLDILSLGNEASSCGRKGTDLQRAFISLVSHDGLPVGISQLRADRLIGELRSLFGALHRWYSLQHLCALLRLLATSRYRAKTWRFACASLLRREDFTNIGGIDLQFSHVADFYPSFHVASSAGWIGSP